MLSIKRGLYLTDGVVDFPEYYFVNVFYRSPQEIDPFFFAESRDYPFSMPNLPHRAVELVGNHYRFALLFGCPVVFQLAACNSQVMVPFRFEHLQVALVSYSRINYHHGFAPFT